MDYQLEIKQIVDYPRCRMYREFIRRIMNQDNGSAQLQSCPSGSERDSNIRPFLFWTR